MMQSKIFVQLIFSLIFLGSRICLPLYDGYEWQEPYYEKHVLQKSNEPAYSQYDEFYSMRGHDKRPGDFYIKGSVPLEESKGCAFCSKVLHDYIENCVISIKLHEMRKEDFPYYDIKTHAERDIEQEILTQKLMEILYNLVLLKVADEVAYDQSVTDNHLEKYHPTVEQSSDYSESNQLEDYHKNYYSLPSLHITPTVKFEKPTIHSQLPLYYHNNHFSSQSLGSNNTKEERVGEPVKIKTFTLQEPQKSKLNESKTRSNQGDLKIKLYRKWKMNKLNSEPQILNKTLNT